MSLVQLLDELIDPHETWSKQYARYANSALSNYNKHLVPSPHVDLYPVEGGMELKADLPGMDKESVKLSVEQNVIRLSGERKSETERDVGKFHYSERRFGKFSRSLALPFNADPSTVTAKFENGVLTVSVPQPETTKEGVIPIQ